MTEKIEIGNDGPRLYQALVIRKGLEACKIGMRLNTAYTPTNLKRAATRFTGETYKRGKLGTQKAIVDLTAVINEAEGRGVTVHDGVVFVA